MIEPARCSWLSTRISPGKHTNGVGGWGSDATEHVASLRVSGNSDRGLDLGLSFLLAANYIPLGVTGSSSSSRTIWFCSWGCYSDWKPQRERKRGVVGGGGRSTTPAGVKDAYVGYPYISRRDALRTGGGFFTNSEKQRR